ncbi:CPBP family intramembrane glutamic endopeptidase [Cellulomonas citrea]|uniref:CPBP family intramembrane glutamic endopeptidase n=1 Tax=Cellulomonas citrea TaxID=1909423 RepID=UPI001358321B|nr:CPBP family intramembrane glutamic endopeptidase [Cellulomonas citrea]
MRPSDLTPEYFLVCSLLISTSIGVMLVRPRPLGLRGERMPRLIGSYLLRIAVLVALALLARDLGGAPVAQFLDAAGALGAVSWVRTRLDPGSGSAAPVLVGLVAVSLLSVSWQYLVLRPFSDRQIGRRLDQVFATTGRAEHTVMTIGSAVLGCLEEVVFRALLPTLLYTRGAGVALAVVAPTVVFVALHVEQKAVGLVNATVVGVVLMAVYLVTGQLLWVIALHATANVLALGVEPEIRRMRERRIVRRAIEARGSAAV